MSKRIFRGVYYVIIQRAKGFIKKYKATNTNTKIKTLAVTFLIFFALLGIT